MNVDDPPDEFFLKPSGVISSRCSLPRWRTTSKPSPNSTPLTALMLMRPCAMSASSLSNTGSPRPTGTRDATRLIRAPIESPALRRSLKNLSSSTSFDGSAQKNGFSSTCSRSIAASLNGPISAR